MSASERAAAPEPAEAQAREATGVGALTVMTDAAARLRHWAAVQPQSPLLLTGGHEYGYADVLRRAEAVATGIRRAGCARGARVALFLDEYDEFFVAMLGAWLAGGVVIPLNTSLPASAVTWLVEKAAPAAVVVAASGACPALRGCELVVTRDAEGMVSGVTSTELAVGENDPAGHAAGDDVWAHTQGDELAMIMFTSGTTGVPKGACQTAWAVAANAGYVAQELGVGADDRIFVNTPPYFTSGICHFLTLLAGGGSIAGHLGFYFGAGLLDEMARLGCSGFGGAPAHLVRVVEPLEEPQAHELRFWVSSGDHLPVAVIEKFARVLPGVRLYNMYGLTEVSGRLCIMPPEELARRVGSVGRPIADMTVIPRHSDGCAVAPGESGELYVAGSLLMREYLDAAEVTAAALGGHGFRTGDFGSVDADGFVWVEGRNDDIIKRGGEKVSTVQVQQALQGLGRFADVAVLAVPDDLAGHVPVAFVVPLDPATFKPSKVLRELRAVLPPSALPSRVLSVPAIPRTGSGKAQRRELLALLAEELG